MKILYVAIIAALAGCGIERPPGEIPGFIEETDNFTLNYPFDYPIGQVVEDLWLTAKMCTNIHIDPPRKIKIDYVVEEFVAPDLHPGSAGVMWSEAHYARIWERDLVWFAGQVTIHEFVHYLLYASGQSHLSINHESPLFHQCAPMIP